MIGAIIGDIAGSTYEFSNIKTKRFPLMARGSNYTDDSLMTIAVGKALMDVADHGGDFKEKVVQSMREIARKYPCPKGGYGGRFRQWLVMPEPKPYGSYGNGSAMRVSACGEIATSLDMGLVDKSRLFSCNPSHRNKKDAGGRHPIHLIILLRFMAAAERRQWSSAAAIPRRVRRVRL